MTCSIYNEIFLRNIEHRKEYGDVVDSYNFIIENNISKYSNILEIGCNIGSLLNLLSESGYTQIIGVDIATEAIKYGRNKYPKLKNRLLACDGDKLPFKNNEFDVVLSFDLLEHIPNAEDHLKEIRRILKPNGIYLFQTPNKIINTPWTILLTKNLSTCRIHHCSLQTYWSLQSILKENAFRDVLIKKRSILTEYKRKKVKKIKYIENILIVIIHILNKMPTHLTSNFWVKARK